MVKNKQKKKRNFKEYPNGGDGMFFYHKKTGHPAMQISHTETTWTNRRYTHNPNNLKNYILDEEMSTEDEKVYYHKSLFTDNIYTRGRTLNIRKKRR